MDHDQAVIHVQTWRTFYKVAIRGADVTVLGPGIQEDFNIEDLNIEHLSYEAIAAICVLQVEER